MLAIFACNSGVSKCCFHPQSYSADPTVAIAGIGVVNCGKPTPGDILSILVFWYCCCWCCHLCSNDRSHCVKQLQLLNLGGL